MKYNLDDAGSINLFEELQDFDFAINLYSKLNG